ncbi:MAG: hypothetical protein IKP26_10695, partial [Clostridia bacterium]|nr:hypothetical protein [Clostridia bacterium]
LIIVLFMIFKPFKLPIPLDAGICLAGAVDLAWFIAFRAYRGAATASEKFACIFRLAKPKVLRRLTTLALLA